MSGADPTERTLVAVLENWPVVAAGVDRADAAIVVHANRVVAASPPARAEGVAVGQRRRDAQRCCPRAVVLAHDPARDARAFEVVVSSLDAVCPRIEVLAAGTVAMATRGPSRYHGGDKRLAERVAAVLTDASDNRCPVRVGVADSTFAATLAAGDAGGEPCVVTVGETPAHLAPRPVGTVVDALGPGVSATVDVLARLGIRTLGDLAALEAADVAARFGTAGEMAHRLARGVDARPLATREPPVDLAVVTELDPPVESVEAAVFVAAGIATDLGEVLDNRGLASLRVEVAAETEHGEILARTWRHEGTLTPAALAERVRWQLDGWLSASAVTRPTAGLTQLRLTPLEVVAARGRQLGFWGGETRLDAEATRALARVAGLVGTEGVRVPEWRGGRGPGEQLALVPTAAVDLGEPRHATDPASVTEPWPGRVPAPAPALVPDEVVTVDLVNADGAPVVVTGRGEVTSSPARVVLAGTAAPRAVTAWAGPWPADERWWDPVNRRRRARLQVIDDTGAAHLLAVEGRRWWREATYD